MKKISKQALRVVERVTRKTVNEWPPLCTGIYHQPKRPVDKERK